MSEPFPAGTRFLVGIILEARTFQEARDEAQRIVGEEAQVSHVFGRISSGNTASMPQVIDPRGTLEDPVL
jgi:hypothetical protein